MMAKRHSDAIAIQGGACNPTAIAHSIIAGCKEVSEEGGGTESIVNDPAIRLMVHQLAFLTNNVALDDSIIVYRDLMESCSLSITA